MADDDTPPASRRTVVCDFCKSKLTGTGEIIKLGDEAREYRDAPEVSRKLREQLTAAEATITQLRADLAKAKDGGKPSSGAADDDI